MSTTSIGSQKEIGFASFVRPGSEIVSDSSNSPNVSSCTIATKSEEVLACGEASLRGTASDRGKLNRAGDLIPRYS
jgi:hypothetical protein